MHSDFLEASAAMTNESLLKTEKLFVSKRDCWFDAFAEHFQSVCAEIVSLQNNLSLTAISYLEYTMLYTNFNDRRYIAEVWVYSKSRYLDIRQIKVSEYDISFLFAYFDELWDKLLSTRKRYLGKVTTREVKFLMFQAITDFFSYLINIVRFSIVDCVGKKPFIDILKNEVFKVCVGNYMAQTDCVYVESKSKDAVALAKCFYERIPKEYIYKDYSSLDFSNHSFTQMEFRYSQFRNAILNDVSFKGSLLIGTNFYSASMENCLLDNCSIHEAIFKRAKLKNASFTYAQGWAGLPMENDWRYVGFLPANFCYADLSNADFSHSNLSGADFTGAILTDANFTEANLTGAVFTTAVLTHANFANAILTNTVFDDFLGRG